jgi:Tfp pilus assembly protein PilV
MSERAAPTRRRFSGGPAARGVSILEVVLATVMLALSVATMASTVGAITSQQRRSAHLLACAELANRLIIQYLDDENALPNEALAVPYGADEYRFRFSVTRVRSALNPDVQRAVDERPDRQAGQSPDRLKKVAVTVWLSEKSGGEYLPDRGAPQQTIVRVVDPLALHRRPPESIQNLMEEGGDRLMDRLLGRDVGPEED